MGLKYSRNPALVSLHGGGPSHPKRESFNVSQQLEHAEHCGM